MFCRTRHGSDRVAKQLKRYGVKTGVIHGRRTQGQRDNTLKAFVQGKTQALIATDVAARGIHVDAVDCVVHFDPPEDDKAYTHRSGRTARAGASGAVVSFVTAEQLKDTKKLQRQIGVRCEFEDPTPPAELDLGDPIIVPHPPKGRGPDGGGKGRGSGHAKNRGSGQGKKQTGRKRSSPGGGDPRKRGGSGARPKGRSGAGQRRPR